MHALAPNEKNLLAEMLKEKLLNTTSQAQQIIQSLTEGDDAAEINVTEAKLISVLQQVRTLKQLHKKIMCVPEPKPQVRNTPVQSTVVATAPSTVAQAPEPVKSTESKHSFGMKREKRSGVDSIILSRYIRAEIADEVKAHIAENKIPVWKPLPFGVHGFTMPTVLVDSENLDARIEASGKGVTITTNGYVFEGALKKALLNKETISKKVKLIKQVAPKGYVYYRLHVPKSLRPYIDQNTMFLITKDRSEQ